MLTVADVKKMLPATVATSVTQTYVDQINQCVTDPVIAEHVREAFVTYVGVVRDGRYKIEDYLKAVQYVTYKHMGYTNQDSYFKTFPDRLAALTARGLTVSEMAPYVHAYAKGKMVNAILEQSLIPMWVLNQDAYQKAINTQVEIMTTSQNDMARTAAANSIMTHLAKPKEAVQLNFDIGESKVMTDLRDTMLKMAAQQQQLIQSGATTKSIAHSTIIDVTP